MVLIPLVQGRFLFAAPYYAPRRANVLIPLVQGRFLFKRLASLLTVSVGLNPFGSGTFFIRGDEI